MSVFLNILVGAPIGAMAVFGLSRVTSPPDDSAGPTLPFAESSYVLGDEIEDYAEFMMSGGPPPDGIPSIDQPRFIRADATRLDPDDMVIGFEHEGGVSGQLLNSNLVLFDRETESYVSQIAATGLTGEYRGRTLDEVNLVWTTWERWRSAYPETRVLSEETGHLRNYSRDPYGQYNPIGGYYGQDRTIFPLMHSSTLYHAKEMVLGGRTAERSAYFVMEELASDRVQTTAHFLAVYDPDLDTGYLYHTGGRDVQVSARGDGTYEIDGAAYPSDALPLDQVVGVEAFYFSWNAFYPDSESP